jgi:hypothetical protein
MLILTDLHFFSAGHDYLPPDSPWWLHDDKNAHFEQYNTEYSSSRLNFANPEMQDKVAALCAALLKTGVYDGCMMDHWRDSDEMGAERLALVRKIRAAIGEKPLLIGNVGNGVLSSTEPYMNGMYMEGFGARFFPDWHTAAANLLWGQSHLRQPAITALEGWYSCPTPDHLHDWYPFWDRSLGHAVGPLGNLERPDLSGAYTRQYEKGEVVFNPSSNRPVTVSFPEPHRSAATNAIARSFTVAAGDGDLFLKDTGAVQTN